jgi:hypothetical protein
MERPPTIKFPKSDLRTSRNGHGNKGKGKTHPPSDDADARYAAALKVVQAIDRNLRNGTCHYYDTQGRLLNTLDEVIHALLTDTLALDHPADQSREGSALEWATASQMVA